MSEVYYELGYFFKTSGMAIFDLNIKMNMTKQILIKNVILFSLAPYILSPLQNTTIVFSPIYYYNVLLSRKLSYEMSIFFPLKVALFFMQFLKNLLCSWFASQTCLFNLYDLSVIAKRQYETSIKEMMN